MNYLSILKNYLKILFIIFFTIQYYYLLEYSKEILEYIQEKRMTEIIDLNSKRKQSQQSPQNTSIDTMLMLLEKYHSMLRQMKDSGVEHLDVTVGDSTLEFVPKSLCVIVGDGSVVLSEGLHGLNSIEALGLQSKLKEIVFEQT